MVERRCSLRGTCLLLRCSSHPLPSGFFLVEELVTCIVQTYPAVTEKMADKQQQWSVRQPQTPAAESEALSEIPYRAADMI